VRPKPARVWRAVTGQGVPIQSLSGRVARRRPAPYLNVMRNKRMSGNGKAGGGLCLTNLKNSSEIVDSGLWVLYLGLGMLRWTDVNGHEAQSPLL
jgi:hypothetical protein